MLNTRIPENLRVLIAEDNPTSLKILCRILEKIGIEADTAINGIATIEAFRERNQQIIFMDCLMPLMDGFEASRIIREETRNSAAPVIIAVTADAMNDHSSEYLRSGMNDYIEKPYRFTDIIKVLDKYLPGLSEKTGRPTP